MTYACKNHAPRADAPWPPIEAQIGWTPDGRRRIIRHETEWEPGECQHDRSDEDRGCDGCRWQVGAPSPQPDTMPAGEMIERRRQGKPPPPPKPPPPRKITSGMPPEERDDDWM